MLNSVRARIFQRAKRFRRFERPACPQHKGVRPDRADDLQPDREPVARHSAGNGRRRLLRQVEWTSERRPIRPRLAPVARWWHQTARLERGQRHGRRQEEVVALKEAGERSVQFRALELRANMVNRRGLAPLRRRRDEAGVGQVADPLAIRLQEHRERWPRP